MSLKKRTPAFVCVFSFFALTVAFAAPVPTPSPSSKASVTKRDYVAFIEKLNGVVTLSRRDGAKMKTSQITFRDRIEAEDRVATKTSRIRLQVKGGTKLTLGDDAEVGLERVQLKPENPLRGYRPWDQLDETTFRFYRGFAKFEVSAVGDREQFIIKTDNGVIQITESAEVYVVQPPGLRDITVRVLAGKVTVVNLVGNETMSVVAERGAILKVTGVVIGLSSVTPNMRQFLEDRSRL